MSEQDNTVVDTGESQTVAETETKSEAVVEDTISVSSDTPTVEIKDGKTYVNGVRMFSRAEKDAVAKIASKDAESHLLNELGVDNLQSVKQVVRQLQTANIDGEGGNSLDLNALKQSVAKKEQTVAELKAELESVKSQYVLDRHVGNLKDAMPSAWTPEQKASVVKLMQADNMFRIEGQSFHIVDGEDFLATDDGLPNYQLAVEKMGKTLGLPFAKKGVTTVDADSTPVERSTKGLDEERIKTDPRYRDAYVTIRNKNIGLSREQITDKMIQAQMDKKLGSLGARSLGTK
jgi:transposase-like protein